MSNNKTYALVLFQFYVTIGSNELNMKAVTQQEIKDIGKKVRDFDNAVWDEFKFLIVLTDNYYKFSQLKEARHFLISTRDEILVEASPYDTIWGIGMSAEEGKNVISRIGVELIYTLEILKEENCIAGDDVDKFETEDSKKIAVDFAEKVISCCTK